MILEVPDGKLYYETEGEGIPCMVPVPGYQGYLTRTLSEPLRKRFQFHFLHMRGNGRSQGFPLEVVTLDAMLADFDALRQQAGVARMGILGHSAMGCMALEYARRYPDTTPFVISIGAPPRMPEHFQKTADYWDAHADPERKRIFDENMAALDVSGAPPEDRFYLIYRAMGPRYWYDPHFDCAPLASDMKVRMEATAHIFGNVIPNLDPTPYFPEIACPVFLAQGIYDFSVPHLLWKGLPETFPNATYVEFERSGHYPMYEERERFDAELFAWMDRNGIG
jgi:proline iminopeptidase